MCEVLRKLRHSKIDQECLINKVEEWRKQECEIYFRPKGHSTQKDINASSSGDEEDDEDNIVLMSEPGNSLLFVYQSHWQRRLLLRYGNEMSFLDATYKTTRYALPLFFLVVKTNAGYQIVATFVCESESTSSIHEALSIIKKMTPEWNPLFFMTDYCNEEINAIESLFPGKYNDVLRHIISTSSSVEFNQNQFSLRTSTEFKCIYATETKDCLAKTQAPSNEFESINMYTLREEIFANL